MMSRLSAPVLCLLLVASLAACEDPFFEPSVRPVEQGLAVAAPIGHAAALAMAAFDGQPSPCAEFSTNCADPPCGGVVDLIVDQRCPLPLAPGAEGRILVTGAMTSEQNGLFTAVFGDVDVSGERLLVERVHAFLVTRFEMDRADPDAEDDRLKVIFYDLDIELAGSERFELSQSMWLVDVDRGDTPGDPSDDRLTIHGVRQGAGRSGDHQAFGDQTLLAAATVDAECPLNPVRGFGIIESADSSDFASNGITMLGFHPKCDGLARILLSAGLGAPSSGTEVELDLLAK